MTSVWHYLQWAEPSNVEGTGMYLLEAKSSVQQRLYFDKQCIVHQLKGRLQRKLKLVIFIVTMDFDLEVCIGV